MKVSIPGPVGPLEGVLWRPEGAPRAAAVVAHPHPLHGGSMDSSVVFRTARALQRAGLAALRFNFRGVGASAGTFDGEAEVEDLRAALDWLAIEVPEVPLWAAGYSFGARTAAALARRDPRVRRVLLVALPVLAHPCAAADGLEGPGIAVAAGEDEFGNGDDLARALPGLAARLEVVEVPGADHFFTDRLDDLARVVEDWAGRALASESEPVGEGRP